MYRQTKRERNLAMSSKASNEYFRKKMLRLKRKKSRKKKQPYKDYLLSNEWKKKRNKKLKEAGNKCEECGSDKKLQVHHKTYKHIFKEPLTDLMVLCDTCHKLIHKLLTEEEIEIEVQKLISHEFRN